MLRKKKAKRDSGTRSKVSKLPWKSKAYREHIAKLPCVVCGMTLENEAHHIRETLPRTMGRRVSDVWVIPLCRPHHTYLHRHSKTFWADVEVDPQTECAAYYKDWSETP